MAKFYAYTRVSTLKQGEKGVSLQEQHTAIAVYAERQGLHITEWFEERLTAAKKGRPLFGKMLKGLRQGEANGVIIHKIDRGARNLRDWADLGELIDAGVSVHFANESLDLLSRGGRLSADIQAVVASDYIRNLREETLKGIRGRLKQGLYPFGAPLGYLNSGGGRVKEIDPVRGPLVREAFELYASGRHTLDSLVVHLHQRGLRNRRGHTVSRNDFSQMLNNSFYAGLMSLRSSHDTYLGKHTPLVTMALFKQVKARLAQRLRGHKWIHNFAFRGLFLCSLCNRHLIGERQKGHVYYRCQTAGCPTRTFREEALEAAIVQSCPPIALTEEWRTRLREHLEYVEQYDSQREGDRKAQIEMQIGAVKMRLMKLVDALLDGVLDKTSFDERRRALLEEQCSLEDARSSVMNSGHTKQYIMEKLELASSALQSYRLGSTESRREMAIRLCSNRTVAGQHVSVEPSFPLQHLANRDVVSICGHHPYATRTLEKLAKELWKWAQNELANPARPTSNCFFKGSK